MAGSRKRSSANNRLSSTRSSGKDKVSDARKYGEALVGSRIRVWWPLDRKFYKGVVDSYVSSKKKHRVFYEDGDKETLDLKKERWELIEEDDTESESDEISLQDESADESSEGTPEPPKGKGKSSLKGRTDDGMPKKKQKIDSSSKSKAKEVEKKTSKPEIEKNGKMGDIGGKIVAAASRMSGRFRSKGKGQEIETSKALKSSKKRPSASTESVLGRGKKPRTATQKSKSNLSDDEHSSDKEEGDDAEIDTSDAENGTSADESELKASDSNADDDAEIGTSADETKIKALKSYDSNADEKNDDEDAVADAEDEPSDNEFKHKALKSNNSISDEESGDNEDGGDAVDEASDEEKPLVSFLKKSPEAIEAMREKLKGKEEEEEGEENSGKEPEEEEEGEEEESSSQ